MNSLVVSFGFLSLTVLISKMLVTIIRRNITDTTVNRLACEVIQTAEVCACLAEVATISTVSVPSSLIALFLVDFWWQMHPQRESSPAVQIDAFLQGRQNLTDMALVIFSELIGAFAALAYIHYYWNLQLASSHAGLKSSCVHDGMKVPVLYGFLVEFFGTFFLEMCSGANEGTRHKSAEALRSLCVTAAFFAGMNLSGGFYHPIVAFSQCFGCKSHTSEEHFMVYWAGPILGCMLATEARKYQTVKDIFEWPFALHVKVE